MSFFRIRRVIGFGSCKMLFCHVTKRRGDRNIAQRMRYIIARFALESEGPTLRFSTTLVQEFLENWNQIYEIHLETRRRANVVGLTNA